MFKGCSKITSIDLSKLDTSNVEYWGDLFSDCESLTYVNLKGLKTPILSTTINMFS